MWMDLYWNSIENGLRQSVDRRQDERLWQPRRSRGHGRAPQLVNTASTSNFNRRRSSSSSGTNSTSSTAGRSKRELVSNTNRSYRFQTQRVNLFFSHTSPSWIALVQCHASLNQLIHQPVTTLIEICIENGWNVRRGQVLRRWGKAPFLSSRTVPSPFWLDRSSIPNNRSQATNLMKKTRKNFCSCVCNW